MHVHMLVQTHSCVFEHACTLSWPQADQAAGKGKKRRDKEDGKDGKKRKRDKDGHKSSRPRRGEGGEEGEPKRRSQEDGPQVSVDSQDFRETDADRDFVEDDEGGWKWSCLR